MIDYTFLASESHLVKLLVAALSVYRQRGQNIKSALSSPPLVLLNLSHGGVKHLI